jgi:hypothetical protein
MNQSRKLLIFGGLVLAAIGMSYGLYYALFTEHQTLDGMGAALTTAFVQAAQQNIPQAHAAIDLYCRTKYDYVRQVDLHSHWIGLAMLMIVLGVVFDSVNFGEPTRRWLAVALLAGSVLFPFGVILQTVSPGAWFPSALAVAGSAVVTVALAAVAWGFARTS